jgi:ubiquinone/menaquinone biosynthesis C-methylase UbiE
MPALDENKLRWNQTYNWQQGGHEWSAPWGHTNMQWYGTILPRIHRFLPAQTVLEIGPGFGRWTQFIKGFCENLILVDISEKCIQACKERFASHPHIQYYVNDGKSLDFISEQSIDFVFSFDALVHAEADVMEVYINQLARKLKKDGIGFIHHSNVGEYRLYYSLISKIPKGKRYLERLGLLDPICTSWRASNMTSGKFCEYAEKSGLQCITQEIINWNTRRLIDCITVFTRKDSLLASPNKVLRNSEFMSEARYMSMLSQIYATNNQTVKYP